MTTALYRHFDENNNLLYVGISLHPIARLKAHKVRSHWCRRITKILIEHHSTRRKAEAAEKKAIRIENPQYNNHFRSTS